MTKKRKPKLVPATLRALTIEYECRGQVVRTRPTIDVEEAGCCHEEMCYCGPAEVAALVLLCEVCGDKHAFDIKYY